MAEEKLLDKPLEEIIDIKLDEFVLGNKKNFQLLQHTNRQTVECIDNIYDNLWFKAKKYYDDFIDIACTNEFIEIQDGSYSCDYYGMFRLLLINDMCMATTASDLGYKDRRNIDERIRKRIKPEFNDIFEKMDRIRKIVRKKNSIKRTVDYLICDCDANLASKDYSISASAINCSVDETCDEWCDSPTNLAKHVEIMKKKNKTKRENKKDPTPYMWNIFNLYRGKQVRIERNGIIELLRLTKIGSVSEVAELLGCKPPNIYRALNTIEERAPQWVKDKINEIKAGNYKNNGQNMIKKYKKCLTSDKTDNPDVKELVG